MPAKRTEESFVCQHCGKSFHPFTSSIPKRFCSNKCKFDGRSAKPLRDRFYEKLQKLPGGCWYIGSGHERIYASVFYQGKQLHGHRVSWLIHRGEIPDGMWVLHNCPGGDHRWCVNPDHLFLGTIFDNNADTTKKKRWRTRPKWKEEDIVAIRKQFASGVSRQEIAKRFSIPYPTIKGIISLRTWRRVQA